MKTIILLVTAFFMFCGDVYSQDIITLKNEISVLESKIATAKKNGTNMQEIRKLTIQLEEKKILLEKQVELSSDKDVVHEDGVNFIINKRRQFPNDDDFIKSVEGVVVIISGEIHTTKGNQNYENEKEAFEYFEPYIKTSAGVFIFEKNGNLKMTDKEIIGQVETHPGAFSDGTKFGRTGYNVQGKGTYKIEGVIEEINMIGNYSDWLNSEYNYYQGGLNTYTYFIIKDWVVK
jgi:hypothetical protein